MGVGSGGAADNVALEALKEAADAQIVAGHTALGRFVPLVVSLCQKRCTYRRSTVARAESRRSAVRLRKECSSSALHQMFISYVTGV